MSLILFVGSLSKLVQNSTCFTGNLSSLGRGGGQEGKGTDCVLSVKEEKAFSCGHGVFARGIEKSREALPNPSWDSSAARNGDIMFCWL